MTAKDPIYIDASKTAVLDHGATTENFFSVAEAVMAFENLPPNRREIAKITAGGITYTADQINRFHYAKSV